VAHRQSGRYTAVQQLANQLSEFEQRRQRLVYPHPDLRRQAFKIAKLNHLPNRHIKENVIGRKKYFCGSRRDIHN